MMVVALHFGPHIVRDQRSAFNWLHSLPDLTWRGVDLFFVLSGFLITSIVLEVRDSPTFYRTFYVRRAFRLLPVYIIILLLYAGSLTFLGPRTAQLGRLFENPLPLWPYILYLQNFAMVAAGSFGPIWLAGTWSLAVEEQFYAILPYVVRRLRTVKLMVLMTASAVILPILLRGLNQKFQVTDQLANYVLLPMRADSLGFGIAVALTVRYRGSWCARNARRIGFVSLAITISWVAYKYLPNPHAIRLSFVNHTGNALTFASILLWLVSKPDSWLSKALASRTMVWLGQLSYSTYLFHPILLCLSFRAISGKDPELISNADLVPAAVAFAATLVASFLSWNLVESPCLRLGRAYHYETSPSHLAVSNAS